MDTYIYIGIAIAAAFMVWLVFFRSRNSKPSWKKIRANAPLDLPTELPAIQRTPGGVAVYFNGVVPGDFLQAIDRGITKTLAASRLDQSWMEPPDDHKNWKNFRKLSDFEVVLIEPNYISTVNYPGCGILQLFNGATTAGTVVGVEIKTNRAELGGRPMMVLPFSRDPEKNCLQLMEDASQSESEHAVLTNRKTLYLHFQGFLDVHPIFKSAAKGLKAAKTWLCEIK